MQTLLDILKASELKEITIDELTSHEDREHVLRFLKLPIDMETSLKNKWKEDDEKRQKALEGEFLQRILNLNVPMNQAEMVMMRNFGKTDEEITNEFSNRYSELQLPVNIVKSFIDDYIIPAINEKINRQLTNKTEDAK